MTAQLDLGCSDAIVGVAAFGLPGSLTSLPSAPLPPEAWARLVMDVRAHNLAGLLGAAVAAEAMPVTEEQARNAHDLVATRRTQSRQVEEAIVETVELLASAGIDTRVLHSPAAGRLDYKAPLTRIADTAELLLPHGRRAEARTILEARNYRPRLAAARDGSGPNGPTRYTATNGSHVVLLSHPAWLKSAASELWKRFETFEINGRQLRALAREERLFDTCARAVDAEHDLGCKRDVAEAVLHADLSAQRAVHLAEAWGVGPLLATSVHTTWVDLQLADVVALSTWARSSQHHDQRRTASGRPSRGAIPRQRGLLARAFDLLPGTMR